MPTTTDIIMGAIRSIRSEFNPKIKELEEKIQKQNEIIEELKKQVELLNRSYKLPI
jgi:cell division protein FtsL